MENKYERMIEDIHEVLIGNQYHEEGLIKKVNRIDKKVDKHELALKIVVGSFTLISVLIAFWKDIISIFHTKI